MMDFSDSAAGATAQKMCCPYLTSLMSGSPILQDGRLVGAVTHVYVSDPTMGYGLYIEWMLEQLSPQQAKPLDNAA